MDMIEAEDHTAFLWCRVLVSVLSGRVWLFLGNGISGRGGKAARAPGRHPVQSPKGTLWRPVCAEEEKESRGLRDQGRGRLETTVPAWQLRPG